MYQFSTSRQLMAMCRSEDKDIAEIMLLAEIEESGHDRAVIWAEMEAYLNIMRESIQQGLDENIKSLGGLIGGNAWRLQQYAKNGGMSGRIAIKAAGYALAVTEVNAAMGKVIAAPTAGSSGTLPGVIVALQEELPGASHKAVGALLVAAAIGKIIASLATLSGAEGGCQAECGSAAAMAAAAAVYMCGGQTEMCFDAAAMALKSLLGLVCDPVAGLVEVPCSKRNAIGVSHAFICADMALAGITSFIPFDEIVEAMARVGRMMSPDFKETAMGGCAATPTAREFAIRIHGI